MSEMSIEEMEIKHGQEAEGINILMGGDVSNPTWEEYIDHFKDEYQPNIRGVRKALEEANMIGAVAGNYCNDTWFQSKKGDFAISFTWRAWGDMMQAIVNKREGYMTYYM